jgi:hypothetical protein
MISIKSKSKSNNLNKGGAEQATNFECWAITSNNDYFQTNLQQALQLATYGWQSSKINKQINQTDKINIQPNQSNRQNQQGKQRAGEVHSNLTRPAAARA